MQQRDYKCDPKIAAAVMHSDRKFSVGQLLYGLADHKTAADYGRIADDWMV